MFKKLALILKAVKGPWRRGPMLSLPHNQERQSAGAAFRGVYLGIKDLYGEAIAEDTIIERMKELDIRTTLSLLSEIDVSYISGWSLLLRRI